MKVISLNIDEIIFSETEKIVSQLGKSRNRYINEAIDFYNKHQKRMMLERKLQKESAMVKEDSLNILRDFEEIDYGD
jgi:metal-responsive CopG/Arc/MetJ family transcriptional regulator